MGGGGGSGGGQAVVQSGLSDEAASAAANAQVAASQMASRAATANTHSAIQAMMGQYGTALTYANPTINTGNQAAAQLNYMLGMPAVSPGSAPTAPIKPTLESAKALVSRSQINQDIQQNSGTTSVGNNIGQSFGHVAYYGAGSDDPNIAAGYQWGGVPAGEVMPGYGLTMAQNTQQLSSPLAAFGSNPAIRDAVRTEIAQDNLDQNLMPTYNEAHTNYTQANNQYDQQYNLYQRYNNQGTASAADIGAIVNNLPGMQFQQKQGINQIQNSASANGMLGSGAVLQQLNEFGQGLSSQYYQNYLGNLQGLAGMGANATSGAMSGALATGQGVGSAYQNIGNTQANAYLAAGQAQASGYTSPLSAQRQKITMVGGGDSGGGAGGMGSLLSTAGGLLSSFMGSSKAIKNVVEEKPSKEDILSNVRSMSLDKWSYQEVADTAHIGPYAEEFQEKFKVGDGKSIHIGDYLGVLLASVCALSDKVDKLQSKLGDK